MRLILLSLFIALFASSEPTLSAPKAPSTGRWDQEWQAIDKLVEEQKMQEAESRAQALLKQARTAGDEAHWTKALIRVVNLRSSLHGQEKAVRFLKEEPWPKDKLSLVTLNLYYAQSLVSYLDRYSWEIRQREKVESATEVDLKAMTADQIYTAALSAYDEIWKARSELADRPIAALKGYIAANNYPDNIRPSLRDSVTYFAVELLANSAYWRPEDSNAASGLDSKALLKADGIKSLSDPRFHPLERLAGALGDLEEWHADKDQDEAALEAALERHRRLHIALTESAQRQVIRKSLEERLRDARDLSWWAMGMGDLADMTRETGDLVAAIEFARQGQNAYPKSVGGLRCASITNEIEAPSFHVISMLLDGPTKRSLQIQAKNLKKLYFRAYRLDLKEAIAKAKDSSILPDYQELRSLVSKRAAHSWEVELDDPKDYETHATFVTPPLKESGLYAILASARADFGPGKNDVHGVNFIVSNLAMTSRVVRGKGFDVTVVDGDSGKPVAGADVRLFRFDYKSGHTLETAGTTDKSGLTHLERKDGKDYPSYFLLAQKGAELALDPSYQYLGSEPKSSLKPSSLIYTDRSVYRPGQKLHWKVVAYKALGDQPEYSTVPGQTLKITLRDANNKAVLEQKVKTNSFGTASGSMMIPTGRLLGRWSLESDYGNPRSTLLVEEYKRPTFEVSLKDAEGALRLNQDVTLAGEGRYYFGLPVAAGTVRWKVSREAIYPWWWGYWFRLPVNERAESVGTGVAKLDDQGKFHIKFRPQAKESADSKGVSYRYRVEADLTDEGGETRSTSRTYRIGFVAVEAAFESELGFLSANAEQQLRIKRTSLDGSPRSGKGTYSILALAQPSRALAPADLPYPKQAKGTPGKATKDDLVRPRWDTAFAPEVELSRWQDGPETSKGELAHGTDGYAVLKVPALSPGAYRVRYETVDEFGAKYQTWKDLVVAGAKTPLNLAAALMVEESTVFVGQKARVFVKSGIKGQTIFFEIFRNGVTRERRILSGDGTDLIEIPVSEADRGGFGVALTAVVDHQLIYLTRHIHVPWDNKELQVDFATFRDKLTPGASETFKVTVRGPKASTGAAEVLAYMYDRSLDFFSPHEQPSIQSLYPTRASAPGLRLEVGPTYGMSLINGILADLTTWPQPQPDRLEMLDGYGVGGFGATMGTRGLSLAEGMADSTGEAVRGKNMAPMAAAPAARSGPQPEKAKEAAETKMARSETTDAPPQGMRRNFDETAFFLPQLLTDKNGTVTFEFKVPDSVTSWNLWAVAVTRDLKVGSAKRETRSVKDLMVRPYLPRFLREGDAAELKVAVNNASSGSLAGEVALDIVDVETGKSVTSLFGLKSGDNGSKQSFEVKANGGTTVTYAVTAPKKVGIWAFKVTAKADSLSDGELRPIPVLPSRMHLAQSRFVTLKDRDSRTMTFEDLAKSKDPTLVNDRQVVTLDGQLFYGALKALPYLATYPYECTEQTLNRFLSTGILASVYKGFPAVAAMAKTFGKRATPLAPWNRNDPNAIMALEESPWLVEAQGGDAGDRDLVKTLDPKAVEATRSTAIASLTKAQNPNGGFPWFQGGPSSPYITLYLLHGFAKATEFGVPVPKAMVTNAWRYVAQYYRDDLMPLMAKDKCCWEEMTFLNYVASAFPDASWSANGLTVAERETLLKYSFKHWKEHSPYLKGYLALTLKRAGRAKDAMLVFDSVMDSSKTERDLGTYWAPEDRSWLWYNDTIETHAFALRALMELAPNDERVDGLVQWLFLNKKLNHWKSTRATAEVIYSLVHYLKKTGGLGVKEVAAVSVGGEKKSFTFEPDTYVGQAQMVIPGPSVSAATSKVVVEKATKGLMFASATWFFSTEEPPTEDRGDFFAVSRRYFRRDGKTAEATLKALAPGDKVQVGDQIEVQISLRAKHAAEYIHLRDPRPAGFEPESSTSRYKWDLGLSWYEEVRDSGSNFFFERLPVGEYTFKYRLRATTAGLFLVGPATVQSMYAPEFTAYSAASRMTVTP